VLATVLPDPLLYRKRKNSLDETLVDAHLEAVPGLGTLAVGGLAGGDLEGAAGQADGALDAQLLALGAVDQLAADLLEGLDLAGGEGDADLVGFLAQLKLERCPIDSVVDATAEETYGSLAKVLLGLVVRHLDGIWFWSLVR
jgi:hypothetical protein